MGYTHYERLRATDAGFLHIEDPNSHLHVGAVALFDASPVTNDDGELRFTQIRSAVEASLAQTPRFRQKLAYVPFFRNPVWVDDPLFNIDYHVRHTALPKPGSIRLVKRLTGRLMSQKLDFHKPLWELWIVEGVEDDRFALIVKAHHCMVDGVGGIDLLAGLMSLEPDAPPKAPPRWVPRAAPSGGSLLVDEMRRRASFPLSMAAAAWRGLSRPGDSIATLREQASALGEGLTAGGKLPTPTPLDDETGPYRRVDWVRCDLQAALETKKALGGTLNDLILTAAAGAFGSFLKQRGLSIENLDFRAAVPVNIRPKEEVGGLGNYISTLFASLPIDEPDPRRRLAKVMEATRELKSSTNMGGWGALSEASDVLFPSLMGSFMKLISTRLRLLNVYVSNIPGPRVPVYLLGSRMLEIYPVAPVVHVLAVALFSYDTGLHWGFNADWDRFPDLHDLIDATDQELEALHKAALEGPITIGDSP